MRSARRSPLFRQISLLLALCFLWSFAVAPCGVAAEAARRSAPVSRLKPFRFTTPSQRLANRPFLGSFRRLPVIVPLRQPLTASRPVPSSPTLLNEVGRLTRPVSPAEAAAWDQELRTTHPPLARVATLHLWLGEYALAHDRRPDLAAQHFRTAQHLSGLRSGLHGAAAYDSAVALSDGGDYRAAVAAFTRLLRPATSGPGYDARACALWRRHALACTALRPQDGLRSVRVASAGSLRGLGRHAFQPVTGTYMVAGHAYTSTHDQPGVQMPMDAPPAASGASSSGASAGDPVNLATGEEEYSPAADLIVYNPHGPAVVWGREYGSLRGGGLYADGFASFGTGWSSPYNLSVVNSGGYALQFPNGGRIPFTLPGTLPTAGSPVACTVAAGFPYLVEYDYDAGVPGGYYFTITDAGRTKWVTGGDPSAQHYLLSRIIDRNGNGLVLASGAGTRTVSDLATATVLLQITVDGTGQVTSASDCYGRSVYYHSAAYGGASEVDQVSQLVPTGTLTAGGAISSAYLRYTYGYTQTYGTNTLSSGSFLSAITVPSPSGTGSSVATITYDANQCVHAITDANGNARTYDYTVAGTTKVTVTNSAAATLSVLTSTYDARGCQTGQKDVNGNTLYTVNGFSAADPYKPSSVTDGNGNTTGYTWDAYGNLLTVTPPSGVGRTPAATTNTWDYTKFALGELTQTQTGTKSPTSYFYIDSPGVTGPSNSGLVSSVKAPLPGTAGGSSFGFTSYAYDALGNVLSISTPGNNTGSTLTTTLGYTSDPGDGAHGVAAYSQSAAVGQPLTVTDGMGKVTHLRYDGRGNRMVVWDALGNETDAQYNIADQPLQATLPATGQQGPGHGTVVNAYLYPGGPLTGTTASDEAGYIPGGAMTGGAVGLDVRQVAFAYGKEGETLGQSGSTEPATYVYDGLYRLTSMTDGGGHATRYYYKRRGYLDAVTYPGYAGPAPVYNSTSDGYTNVTGADSVRFLTYDLDGDVTSRINGNGVTTSYTYNDPQSLVTLVHYTYPGGYAGGTTGDVAYHYDAYGRRDKMSDGVSGTIGGGAVAAPGVTYTYDDLDEPLSVATAYTGGPTQTVSYGYWPDGSRQSMALSCVGGGFSYTYDAAGRMTGLTNPYGEASSWQYLDNGWLWKQTLSNGVTTAYTYNALGQLTDLQTRTYAGVLLSEYGGATASTALLHDGAGGLTRMTAAMPAAPSGFTGVETYQYDYGQTANPALNRGQLTGETSTRVGGYTNAYAYDGGTSTGPGNPTTVRNAGGLSFNADNQRTGSGFAYDGDGSPTTYGGTALKFDPEDRLTQYGTAETNGYTGDGLRARKTTGGSTTYYVYDGDEPVAEVSGSGVVAAVHTFGANGLLSRSRPGASPTTCCTRSTRRGRWRSSWTRRGT